MASRFTDETFPYPKESSRVIYYQFSSGIVWDYNNGYPNGLEDGWDWETPFIPVPHLYLGNTRTGHSWARLKIGNNGKWSVPYKITPKPFTIDNRGTLSERPDASTLQEGSTYLDTETNILYTVINGEWDAGVATAGNTTSSGSTAPANPSEGDIWFDTVTNTMYIYENGEWVAPDTSGNTSGASIDHTLLLNRGANTHAVIDNHLANTSNPHNVLSTQITDFDTEVDNNTNVAANTAHRGTVTGNPHNVLATQIGDIDTEISNNTDVASNTSHTATVTGNPHNVLATQVSDFDTEVSNNTDVTSNTAHTATVTGNPHNLSLNDLSDAVITTPSANATFQYVGASWIDVDTNTGFNLDTGTTTGTIATGDHIQAVNRGGTGQTSYVNGQLLIGNTSGNTLTPALLTGGTGVTITNGTGTITIDADNNGTVTSAAAGNGMNFTTITATGSVTLGTPSTLTSSTANGVTSTSHTHDITTGVSDDDIVKINSATVVDDDYAKFTGTGLEGRSYSQVKTDLTLNNVENTAISTWAGSSNVTTLGTISTGTWQGTTVAVNQGGTGQTTYTNGQVLIGNSTGNTLTPALLTEGTGINITNSTGSITIASDVSGINYWTEDGSDLYYSTGEVGIGRIPLYDLDVYANDASTAAMLGITQDGAGDAALRFKRGVSTNYTMGIDSTDDSFKITDSTILSSSFDVFRILDDKVTINPGASGATPSGGADNFVTEDSGSNGISILGGNTSNTRLIFGNPSNSASIILKHDGTANNFLVANEISGGEINFSIFSDNILSLDGDGNVSLGNGNGNPTNASRALVLENGNDGTAQPTNSIALASEDAAVGGATLALNLEQNVAGAPAAVDAGVKIKVNGTEYWLHLTAV